jgi:hypothetical protein
VTAIELDYDALSDSYRQGLTTKLRGFRAGDETTRFLDTWVSETDDARSLQGLLDAAADGGVREIRVHFGTVTLGHISADDLRTVAAAFGVVRATSTPDRLTLDITLSGHVEQPRTQGLAIAGARATAAPRSDGGARRSGPPAAAVYDAALDAVASFAHEGEIEPPAGTVRAEARWGDARIAFAVTEGAVVAQARHHGAAGRERALLERFCDLVEGLPLREVADHAAIRLELALRGRGAAPPVAGVTTPGAADERLGHIEDLSRALASAWEAQRGPLPVVNEFTRPLGAAWRALDGAARAARVAAVVADVVADHGLARAAAACSRIEPDGRVVIAFSDEAPLHVRPRLAMVIDWAVKDRIDPELSIYLEERRDANRGRQLTTPKEHA